MIPPSAPATLTFVLFLVDDKHDPPWGTLPLLFPLDQHNPPPNMHIVCRSLPNNGIKEASQMAFTKITSYSSCLVFIHSSFHHIVYDMFIICLLCVSLDQNENTMKTGILAVSLLFYCQYLERRMACHSRHSVNSC